MVNIVEIHMLNIEVFLIKKGKIFSAEKSLTSPPD